MKNFTDQAVLLAFGKRVRELREKKLISQEGLAALASVHRTYIGMIERGEKNVTLITILRLAKALEISPSLLFLETT
jgi:transcriptional regulator with XRE-family HTH domain